MKILFLTSCLMAGAAGAQGCRGDASLRCQNADLSDKAVQLCLYPWTAEVDYDGQNHVYQDLVLSSQSPDGPAYTATGFGLRVNTAADPTLDGYSGDFSATDLGRANVALRCQPL